MVGRPRSEPPTTAIQDAGRLTPASLSQAFSATDFTGDLKAIHVPVLVMHGEDDQIVPIHSSAIKSIKLLRSGTLKTYPGLPHGMCQTHPDLINSDLPAFIRS